MKIKKVAQTPGVIATVSTSKIDSDKDTYSCNYLNDNAVVVSPTEPSDGKIWIQASKNVFDGEIELGSIDIDNNGVNSDSTTRTRSKNYIKVHPNTVYTFTRTENVGYRWIIGYDINKKAISDGGVDNNGTTINLAISKIIPDSSILTFKTSPTTEYIRWYDTTCTNIDEKVQIEQGEYATPYEVYCPKKLHTLHDNGYQELMNMSNIEKDTLNSKHVTDLAPFWSRYWTKRGYLGEVGMWWRILELPLNFCGFIFITTPNYSGTMSNFMLKAAYSFNNPVLEVVNSIAFAGKIFSNARICYTKGGKAYLELMSAKSSLNVKVGITFIGSWVDGSFKELDVVGDSTNYQVKEVTL